MTCRRISVLVAGSHAAERPGHPDRAIPQQVCLFILNKLSRSDSPCRYARAGTRAERVGTSGIVAGASFFNLTLRNGLVL